MTPRYYKRETVVYLFKHNILTQAKYLELNEAQKEILWQIHLLTLKEINKVSKYQAATWKYPKNELT
jgi:hypothetical protein